MTLRYPLVLLGLFLLSGQVISLLMPSTVGLISPRFLFACGHFLACGVLLLCLVRRGYLQQPIWLVVLLLALSAIGLPLIKLYFG